MQSLLNETRKYDELLFIDKETNSTKVKEKLTEFIMNNKEKTFDEVFFYYTGHGDFRDNEFYYILSDFSKDRYRQTSLSNSELDNFLRQLESGLTIKVVDACHSGVTYIKDNDIFAKYLDESKKHFSNCYFMFSSMSDQVSYQSNIISHFTKSFIDSVTKYTSTEIRYKHIIDYISDEFEKNALQKPLFVTQASFTEIFCPINQKIKNLLLKQMNGLLNGKPDSNELKRLSVVDLVKRDAERYCSEEEMLEALNVMKSFTEGYEYSAELIELYQISSEFENDYMSIHEYDASIGKWLDDNDNNYFSRVTYQRNKIIQNKASTLAQAIASISFLSDHERYRTVTSGFDLTVEVPFKLINIDASPKYLNLDRYDCKITFVFSQVSIRFFYFYSSFKLENWNDYSPDSSSDWQTVEVEIKDLKKLKDSISDILNKFNSFVMDPLKAKYILTVDSREIER